MNFSRTFFCVSAMFFSAAEIFAAGTNSTLVATTPVYVPNTSYENEPMPDGILAWDSTSKSVDAAADADR